MFYEVILNVYTLLLTLVFVARHLTQYKTYDVSTLGKKSWWLEVLFLVITGGAYMIPYYLRTTAALNKQAERPIPRQFQALALSYTIIHTALFIAIPMMAPSYSGNADWHNISRLIQSLDVVLFIVWSFQIRRLVMDQSGMKISAVLTFILGTFYVFYFVRKAFGNADSNASQQGVLLAEQSGV